MHTCARAGAESDISTLEVTYSSPTNPDDQETTDPSPPDDQNSVPNDQNPETTTPNYFFVALPIIVGISVIAIGICLLIILQKKKRVYGR